MTTQKSTTIRIADASRLMIYRAVFGLPQVGLWAAAAFFLGYIITGSLQMPVELIRLWSYLSALGAGTLKLTINLLDAYLKSKRTALTLKEHALECEISGFSATSLTIPLDKISNVYVTQNIVDTFLNLATVVVSQDASTLIVGGFDPEQARQLSQSVTLRAQSRK